MESISLIFKTFWSPGEAMSRVAKSGKALAPIILITLVGIAAVSVMFTHLNLGEVTLRMQAQTPRIQQMSSEQKAQMVSTINSPMVKGVGWVFGFIGPTLVVLVVAVLYFGLFTLFGREAGFRGFFAVTAFAFLPILLRNIATILTILIVPSSQIMLDEIGNIGPAVFLDRASVSKYLFAAVIQADVVSLWILILLVIGYGFLVRKSVSKLTRICGVFSLWLVYVALKIAFA